MGKSDKPPKARIAGDESGRSRPEALPDDLVVEAFGGVVGVLADELSQPALSVRANLEAALRLFAVEGADHAEAREGLADALADLDEFGRVLRALRTLATLVPARFGPVAPEAELLAAMAPAAIVANRAGVSLRTEISEPGPPLDGYRGGAGYLALLLVMAVVEAQDAAGRGVHLAARRIPGGRLQVTATGAGPEIPGAGGAEAEFRRQAPWPAIRTMVESRGGRLEVAAAAGTCGVVATFTLPLGKEMGQA